MDNKKTILFDPGFAPLIINSIGQVGYVYYMFNAINNIKIKRQNFPLVVIKIEKLLKENVAFYLGCLLWASYISKLGDCEISGNKLLGEECSQEEYTREISFLVDFVENQLPRDYKYYKNKQYISDERYLSILKTYKEFLILNNGFMNCSKTNQIVLPSNIKILDNNLREEICNKINDSINQKNIIQLLDCYNLIF